MLIILLWIFYAVAIPVFLLLAADAVHNIYREYKKSRQKKDEGAAAKVTVTKHE